MNYTDDGYQSPRRNYSPRADQGHRWAAYAIIGIVIILGGYGDE